MTKKHLSNLIATFALILGISFLLYPSISNYFNYKNQTKAVVTYEKQIGDLDDVAKQNEIDKALAYNETLVGDNRRFVLNDTKHTLYNSILNMDNGMMGYITIPKLSVKLPIYHGNDEATLQVGVGHLEGSSLPVGGSGSHCVLLGHRGLPSAKLFTDIDKLEIGDTFTLEVYGLKFTYMVDQILIVDPDDYSALSIEEDKDYCTLLTCTPYGINTKRLLVRGHRVNDEDVNTAIVTSDAYKVNKYVAILGLSAFLLIIYYLFMLILKLYRRKRYEDFKRKRRMIKNEEK